MNNFKNKLVLLSVMSLFILNPMVAQIKKQQTRANSDIRSLSKVISNVTNKSCFCCGNNFNIPKPVINVPSKINCSEPTTFTTTPCEGANVFWNVTPNIIGATSTPTSFTIPANSPPGEYTILLSASCGRENIIRTEHKFKIEPNTENCTPNFLVTVEQLPTGLLKISTNPTMQTTGQEHWWAMQYDGTFPNCNRTPYPFEDITPNSVFGGHISTNGTFTPYAGSGAAVVNGYGLTYSGFPVSRCIRITHYVKCCGEIKGYSAFFFVQPLSNQRTINSDKSIILNPTIIYN